MRIVDHVWRPSYRSGNAPPAVRLRCAYMSCGRIRAEHERSVSLRFSRWGEL